MRSFLAGTAKRLFKDVDPKALARRQTRKARKKERAEEAAALGAQDPNETDDEVESDRTSMEEPSTETPPPPLRADQKTGVCPMEQ